jgi:hypothetical protein
MDMFQQPYSDQEKENLEKIAYHRKKLSIKRLTILFFGIDIAIGIYVIVEIIRYIESFLS